jgi:hypothetical protein
MQRVVDDVLGQIELRVEDVIARGPADLDAVGRGYALLADGVSGQALQVFGAEGAGYPTRDAKAYKGDATGEEAQGRDAPFAGSGCLGEVTVRVAAGAG